MKELSEEKNIQRRINALVGKYQGKRVVIYGAGDYFLFLRDRCDLSGLNGERPLIIRAVITRRVANSSA